MAKKNNTKSQESDTNSNENKGLLQLPYEGSLSKIIDKLQNQSFLFVLAVIILLIGGSAWLATKIESSELRFIIVVISFLAFVTIIAYYIKEILQGLKDLRHDVENVKENADKTVAKIDRADRAAERALELVYRHLETDSQVPAEQLKEAISVAPLSTRAAIWERAHKYRRENWQDNKGKMELSIPIFTALVELDTKDEYHRYHAQLGYALKDKQTPDWMRAEAEISKAIEIRDKREERPGFVNYEFNRAICKINLDDHFLMDSRSTLTTKESILTDLSVAALNPGRLKLIESISPFTDWINLNCNSSEEYLSEEYLPEKWM